MTVVDRIKKEILKGGETGNLQKKQMSPEEVAKQKKRIYNSNGSVSTERSMTIGVDGGFINVPTIWGGKQLTKDQAIKKSKSSGIEYKRYKTIKEAVTAAKARSKAIGKYIR